MTRIKSIAFTIAGWFSFTIGTAIAIVLAITFVSIVLGLYVPTNPGMLLIGLVFFMAAYAMIVIPVAIRYDCSPTLF